MHPSANRCLRGGHCHLDLHVDPRCLHHTTSQQPHHPLQLPRPPLWPRHTRLYHPLHQLVRHRDILTVLALVNSSLRLAFLLLRPPLTAASCCHGFSRSAAGKPKLRAHSKGEGVHWWQIVAAPDARTLQQAWGNTRGHPLCLPVDMPEA